MSKKNKTDSAVKTGIKRFFLFILALVFVALFYVIAIVVEPEEDTAKTTDDSLFLPVNVLSPQSPHHIDDASQIGDLTYLFPAPLLFLQDSESVTFLGADMYDLTYQQGYARVARLSYEVDQVTPVYLYSIYPKEAFSLLGKKNLSLTTNQEYLSIFPAVRMESADEVRLHAQGNLALYALSAPSSLTDKISTLGRNAVPLAQPFNEGNEPATQDVPSS